MRLKTFLPAAAAVALCFTACSSDNDGPAPDPTIEEGAEASLVLSFGNPESTVTRAADNNYATDDEVRFATADIFIYAGNTLAKHVRLTESDFTDQGDNIWTTKDPIRTTSGEKDIYVGLNLPTLLGEAMAATGNKTGLSLVGNTDTYPLINTLADLGLSGNDTAFVMFSTESKVVDLVADNDLPTGSYNQVKVKVGRLVAKVTVQKGDNLSLSLAGGTLSNLQFAIRNSNKLFYPFQQEIDGTIVDLNHYDGSYRASDFNQFDDYVTVDDFNESALTRKVKYTPENTTAMTWTAETTYASVSAVYIPASLSDVNGDQTDNNSQISFWTVTKYETGAVYYFDNKTDANTFAEPEDIISGEYKNGMCYYNLFLNPQLDYQTYRNNFYQCRITNIVGLGNPDPADDGDEEDVPVPRNSNIIFEVDIQPWVLSEWDYELF